MRKYRPRERLRERVGVPIRLRRSIFLRPALPVVEELQHGGALLLRRRRGRGRRRRERGVSWSSHDPSTYRGRRCPRNGRSHRHNASSVVTRRAGEAEPMRGAPTQGHARGQGRRWRLEGWGSPPRSQGAGRQWGGKPARGALEFANTTAIAEPAAQLLLPLLHVHHEKQTAGSSRGAPALVHALPQPRAPRVNFTPSPLRLRTACARFVRHNERPSFELLRDKPISAEKMHRSSHKTTTQLRFEA